MARLHRYILFVAIMTIGVSTGVHIGRGAHRSSERVPDYAISNMILNRTSKRAMSGEEISAEQLMSLLEAMRWAPSAFNEQPWRVLYALRDTPEWEVFFNLLVPFNQEWVKDAAVLLVLISRNDFSHNNTPNTTHSFDAGAAWQNLALQGSIMGLVVHAMSGFDYGKARTALAVPKGYTVEAMVAIGKPVPHENLPQVIRTVETTPSGRKPVDEFSLEGKWSEHLK